MNHHDVLAWLSATGPFFSGSCIGLCTIIAAVAQTGVFGSLPGLAGRLN